MWGVLTRLQSYVHKETEVTTDSKQICQLYIAQVARPIPDIPIDAHETVLGVAG